MLTRILLGFGVLVMLYGAYSAFIDKAPVMMLLLILGAVAVAVPAFLDPKR